MNTVVVQLTSRGMGAIGVLMIAGSDAAQVLAALSRSPKILWVGEVWHTNLFAPSSTHKNPVVLDDALAVRTGDHQYELQLHGGIAVVESVLAALAAMGVQTISNEQAEALGLFGTPGSMLTELAIALPRAQTMTAVRLLATQAQQGLTMWAKRWLGWLEDSSRGAGEGDTRYAAKRAEIWRLHSAAQWLSVRSATLRRLFDPPRIAIIGPPNAGKSTLVNSLLGRPISITSDLAGTTRDWVDAQAIFVAPSLDGPPVEVQVTLVDTAGVRDTTDPLEQESIRRTHGQAQIADAIILLLDATNPPNQHDLDVLHQYPGCAAVIGINKIDLVSDRHPREHDYPHAIALSAKNHHGLDQLMAAVLTQLDLVSIGTDEPCAFSQRHHHLLEMLAIAETPVTAERLLRELIDGHARQ